jgi:hypothetical protein
MSLLLVFNSCSRDDEEKENNSIVGVWKFKEAVAGEIKTNSTVNNGKLAPFIADWGKEDFGSFIYTFTADGAFTLKDSDGPESGTYTYKDGILKLMWGQPDDYDTYKVAIENGVFYLYEDYTEYCNRLELNELIQPGISDPVNFTVTKAIAKINFNRQ